MISRAAVSPMPESVELVHPAIALNRSLVLGAAWGVVAWASYALVEYMLCAIWPLFTTPEAVFTTLNWKLSAWLFDTYWVLGGAAGALAGVAAQALPRNADPKEISERSRLAAASTLYAAIIVHLLTGPPLSRVTEAVLATSAFLLSSTLWVLFRRSVRVARWATMSPLLAASLIVGPAWFSGDVVGGNGAWRRRLAAAGLAAAIVAANRAMSRLPSWNATRHLAASLGVLALVIGASAALSGRNRALPPAPATPGSDPGLNPVVLFSFDTTRADHLSVYGYGRKTTPNLERFARGATLYTDPMAASDMTLASHGSIFTGLYPSWHEAHMYGSEPMDVHSLSRAVPTLASTLKERGVFTAAVVANNAFLTPEWGLGRGFETFVVQRPVEVLSYRNMYFLRHGIRRLLSCCFSTLAFDQQFRSARRVNEDVLGMMENAGVRMRSFFLFVNYMDAHTPYIAPLAEGSPLPDGSRAPTLPEYRDFLYTALRDGRLAPSDVREQLIERYDAGVAAEDAAFEELVGWLKRRGLYDRALIIVTADHGEAFGEHGLMMHGVGAYEHQVHVPLLIKYPHQQSAQVVRTPVSQIDLMPTVLDTLGIPIPAGVQGQSLREGAPADRALYTESFPQRLFSENLPKLDRVERAVRLGNNKLVVSTRGKHELFDLSQDAGEQRDLTASGTSNGPALESLMQEFLRKVPTQTAKRVESEDQMRRLRGLGYVK